jgi:hypothetical protein
MSLEHAGKRFVISADCDWLQFRHWRTWAWINLRLLECAPEWDRLMGSVSLSVALAGFCLRIGYTYNPSTPFRQDLHKQMDELNGVCVSVPCDVWRQVKAAADAWGALAPVESLGRDS